MTGRETAFSTVWVGFPDCLNRLTAARRPSTIALDFRLGEGSPILWAGGPARGLSSEGCGPAIGGFRRSGIHHGRTGGTKPPSSERRHERTFDIATEELGLADQDCFVLVTDKPVVQHKRQEHARKNHSFLWVFRTK